MEFILSESEFDELIRYVRAGRTKHLKSEHKNISFASSGYSRAHFTFSKNQKAKQSVVKMISNLGRESIKRCIDYALKNSLDGYAINEKGERVSSDDVMREWSKDFGTNKNSKDAWHLMFSINEPVSDEKTLKALVKSVKTTLDLNFNGHKYAFVLHTHQNNPHVHVILNKRNEWTKNKIHFDSRSEIREFFDDVRTNFAYSLGANGLNYENRNFLQKDLKKEFSKIKSATNLERDDYTAKDRTLEYYDEMREKNKQKHDATASRIEALNNELAVLKKANYELEQLFLLNMKKKSKKRFKLGKELKESNKILEQKRKAVLGEIKKINKISFDATRLDEMRLAHYKDRSDALILLENFSNSYNKIHPKGKNSSKADWQNYKSVRKSIAVLRGREDDLSRRYFSDDLATSRFLGRNESIFRLDKKLEIIDKNLYLLNQADLSENEKNEFKKRLDSNKEFITDMAKKRFEYIEKRLTKAEKINNDDFLFKEYFKGVALLGIRADERLVKIKNERRLYTNVLKEKGSGLSNSQTLAQSVSVDKLKNERGGR